MHVKAKLRFPWLAVLLLLAALCPSRPAMAARFAEPLVVTSAGQSGDLLLVRQFLIRAGLPDPRIEARLVADSLAGVETLVVVAGGSAKGLGQAKDAGTQELERIAALLDKAEAEHIQVFCLHVGREGRRGPLSDQFIDPVARRSNQLLVLDGGNEDGLFSTIAEETGIPLIEAADYKDCVTQLNRLFGWELPER